MIRRIRGAAKAKPSELVATPAELVDEVLARFKAPEEQGSSVLETDPSLGLLLKHAMRSQTQQGPDAKRIWRQLRMRVAGPFGSLAVEGPACTDDLTGNSPFNLDVATHRPRVAHRAGSQAAGDVICGGFLRDSERTLMSR